MTGTSQDVPEPPATAQETARRLVQNTGLLLALLYAGGALALVADLRSNGVPVTDVFPIIPIEQHLARSVGLLVSPRGLLLGALLVATVIVLDALAQRRGRATGAPAGISGWLSRQPVPAIGLLIAAYAALIWFRPLLAAQQSVTLLTLWGLTRLRPGVAIAASTRFVVMGFALLVGFVLRAYTLPQPLPATEVIVEGAAPVTGRFIAVVDNSWYVADSPGVMRVVGEKHVITARVVGTDNRLDWKESTLPGLLGG